MPGAARWLLSACAAPVCHKATAERMPSSSPRGLVEGLPMVLLSALSSEHFLTWLLSMLWAGTWHRAASAPEALVLFQTKCHRSWLSRPSEEGEAGVAAALTHSGCRAGRPCGAAGRQSAQPAVLLRAGPLAVLGAARSLGCCRSRRDLSGLWSCCQRGLARFPGDGRAGHVCHILQTWVRSSHRSRSSHGACSCRPAARAGRTPSW